VLHCRHFRENLGRREGKRGREVKFSGGNKVIELGDKWVSLPFVIPTMKGSTSHTHTETKESILLQKLKASKIVKSGMYQCQSVKNSLPFLFPIVLFLLTTIKIRRRSCEHKFEWDCNKLVGDSWPLLPHVFSLFLS
jgi:hypothetical protein